DKRLARRVRGGFTLVEVIVVVVIIGVLATLIAPRILSRIGSSRQSVARANAATLRTQVTLFAADCRPVQSTDTLRGILWEKPTDVPEGSWVGPYVEKQEALIDPWGREIGRASCRERGESSGGAGS